MDTLSKYGHRHFAKDLQPPPIFGGKRGYSGHNFWIRDRISDTQTAAKNQILFDANNETSQLISVT
jgi:hypothetical protein